MCNSEYEIDIENDEIVVRFSNSFIDWLARNYPSISPEYLIKASGDLSIPIVRAFVLYQLGT